MDFEEGNESDQHLDQGIVTIFGNRVDVKSAIIHKSQFSLVRKWMEAKYRAGVAITKKLTDLQNRIEGFDDLNKQDLVRMEAECVRLRAKRGTETEKQTERRLADLEKRIADFDASNKEDLARMKAEWRRLNESKKCLEEALGRTEKEYQHMSSKMATPNAALELIQRRLAGGVGHYNVKRAVLAVANIFCPRLAATVEALGHLWLRTPAFFFQHSKEILTHLYGPRTREFLTQMRFGNVLPMSIDPKTSTVWQMVKHVDNLIQRASRLQDEQAIREMFSIISSDQLPEHVQEHVVRGICEAKIQMDEHDKVLREIRGIQQTNTFTSAVLLHWPREKTHISVYSNLFELLKKAGIDENNLTASKRDICGNELDTAKRQVDELMGLMEQNFKSACLRDPLLHVSKEHVVQVLLDITQQAVYSTKEQEAILYGLLAVPGTIDGHEHHWSHRRHAATQICKLAEQGNQYAQNILCNRLFHDPHWLIQQHVIATACPVLSRIDPDNELFMNLAEPIVFFSLGLGVDGNARTIPHGEVAKRLQASAEAALKELFTECPPAAIVKVSEVLTKHYRGSSAREAIYERLVGPVMSVLNRWKNHHAPTGHSAEND